MNKISKKIVALATMAAFVLTLVPAAAFAATDTDPLKSSVQTVEKNVEVNIGDQVKIKTTLIDSDNAEITTEDEAIYFWVEDEEGNVINDVDYYGKPGDKTPSTSVKWLGEDRVFATTMSSSGGERAVAIKDAGTYVIKAGVDKTGGAKTVKDLAKLQAVTDYSKIVVSVPAADSIGIWDTVTNDKMVSIVDGVGEFDLVEYDGFTANGTDKFTVTGWVYDENGKTLANQEVTISSGMPTVMSFVGEAADGVITTDKNGQFSFQFTMNDNRNVPITITSGDASVVLRIQKETSNAYDIDTVEDGGYVLAGNDTKNWTDAARDFSDAVQFSITDIKGDAITGPLNDEPATNNNGSDPNGVGTEHGRYLDVTSKPEKSKLDAWDLVLVPLDNGNYSLKYVGAAGQEDVDLIPGEYTVKVALLSGDYAEASFTVAKFGTVQDIVLDMTAHDKSTNRAVAIDDEVTLGQRVEVTAKYVDENGLKIVANDGIDFGANGKAVTDVNYGLDSNWFSTKADVASNESLLGTTITVTAFSQKNKAYVEQELTVVDSYNAFGLEFDPTEGPVNEDNDVTVKVVKEDGSVAKVNGELQAYVADQSNEDAVVTIQDIDNVKAGKGKLTVYASEPTTVDIVVAVKDDSNQGLYAATLEYTVGNVDITAHHNVVMTIGSSEYVVDKQLFTMDAAPYVDSNWRTMVPIRALAEAFDATVTYDNDARTVTIEYNDQTIVMTIDDATYTVNGVEGEMDTEAVINSADDRTYVPIRFAAEAMGFTVTALYDENSSTASVVFQS